MSRISRDAWSDAEMLEMLHLREIDGLSCAQAGERIGRNKNEVIGMHNRIGAAQEPGGAGDGTMPPRWWQRQEAAQ